MTPTKKRKKNDTANQYPEKLSEFKKLLEIEPRKDNDAVPNRKLA